MTSLGLEPNTDEQRKTHRVRRAAVDHNVPIITNLKVSATASAPQEREKTQCQHSTLPMNSKAHGPSPVARLQVAQQLVQALAKTHRFGIHSYQEMRARDEENRRAAGVSDETGA